MTSSSGSRSGYRTLERRATLALACLLVALSALAWWSTVQRAGDMGGMTTGLGSVGNDMMAFDMSAGVFLAMWATMMVAMMLPTVAPIVLLHRMVVRRRGEGPASTIAFATGYLVVWTLIGVVPLVVLVSFRQVARGADWAVPVSGFVLVAAGAYQFTRWKERCQRGCRNPMSFLMTHDFGSGLYPATRTGVVHGLYCLGCCWALMAVLFVVGLMNLAWMAAIAVVFIAERNWRYGELLSKVVGVAVALLGIVVLVDNAVLSSIAT